MMISGVITKCGVYGIIRLSFTLFQNIPETSVEVLITGFGAVSCFICVTMAFQQHDFKRLLAFHSISQVGYVITAVGLGSALGLSAGLYHAMNHTFFKSLLFLCAGAVQYATGSLNLDKLGGLAKKMPNTCILFLIGAASISGLPPFNGFASKWMIYQAAFEKGTQTGNFYYVVICVVCLISSVLTLASFVKVAQSVFFGQLGPGLEDTKEVPLVMRIPMWTLAVLCILTGILPGVIQKNFTGPAAAASMNAANYIETMLGTGTAAAHGIAEPIAFEPVWIGAWSPVSWLCLLLVVTCAVCIVAVLGTPSSFIPQYRDTSSADTAETGKGLLFRRFAKKASPEALSAVSSASQGTEELPAVAEGVQTISRMGKSGGTKTYTGEPDPKYEVFFSGEQAEYSQVGGSDLFWGFKHNMRRYFRAMKKWHSGITGDYVRYGIAALAFVLLYASLFL